ncbi:MAG: hypothetical protein ACSW8A_04840 [Lachnospiraceae bacterium]
MKKKLLVVLLAAVMVFMLAACGSKTSTEPEEKTDTSEYTVRQPSSFDEKCLDEIGNPTLYAFTELTGPELIKLLEEQGYEWERKDDTLKRFKRKVMAEGTDEPQFVTVRESNGLDQDIWELEDFENAAGKGGAAVGQTVFVIAGYADPDDGWNTKLDEVVKAIVNTEIVDQYMTDDAQAVLVITRDSSGKDYAVLITVSGGGRSEAVVYTDEVLANRGSSIAAEWTAFTGQETYGQ